MRIPTLMVTILVSACGPGSPGGPGGPGGSTSAPLSPTSAASGEAAPTLCVSVSVDWEGAYFEEADLASMEAFTDAAPGVPLTHLLNAAYFTKEDADATWVTAQIRRAIRDIDETGLHVHAWESLAERAGVTPREEPSFLSDEPLIIDGDAGFDIRLESYEVDEIRGFVRTSRALLEDHGFALSTSFRAGGWLAGPRVLEAIRAEGFEIDTSATDASWLDESADLPIQGSIRAIWPEVTPTTQPFFIATPAGRVLEMPDTGGLADYVTEDEMLAHVRQAIEEADAAAASGQPMARPRFVHLGFHQEGAADFSPRVVRVIQALRAEYGPDRVAFETLESCAARARTGLGVGR